MGVTIRRAGLGVEVEHLPLVVARQMHPVLLRHQVLCRLLGQQGAGQAVAQIDHLVHATTGEVGHHGQQRRKISVDV